MRIRAIIPVIVLLIAAVGCGDDSSTDGAQPGESNGQTTTTRPVEEVDLSDVEWVDRTDQDEVMVQARDNTFLPGYIEVKAGTPITFRNVGRTDHNVLPSIPGQFEPIEVEDLTPGDEATITFDEPGDYPYYCSLHGTTTRGMIGAVRVVE